MEVINAGQHILQGEGVVQDTVGGVPEGQGQLRSCEATEEGQEQRCQGTFPGAGLTQQEQYEFRFAACQLQEVIQRCQKGKGQQRQQNLLRGKAAVHQVGDHLRVHIVRLLLHPVALHLAGEVYGHIRCPRHQELPRTADLLPSGHRVDSLVVSSFGGGLDGVADTVLDILSHFQNAVDPPVLRHPVEAAQLIRGNLDLRQDAPALMDPLQAYPGGSLGAIIKGHLAGDPGHEITQLPVVGTLLAVLRFQKTVVHDLIAGSIGRKVFDFTFGQYRSPFV